MKAAYVVTAAIIFSSLTNGTIFEISDFLISEEFNLIFSQYTLVKFEIPSMFHFDVMNEDMANLHKKCGGSVFYGAVFKYTLLWLV